MKNTKRCFVMYSFFDRTNIEKYLENQAQKGWILKKINSFTWQFYRIEPKKINFSVVYFSKASSFDPEPSEKQLEFQDFCEHTGWQHVASSAQIQIYCNESENPTPIETDAALEVNSIHTSAKKSYLPTFYLLSALAILQIGLLLSSFLSDPVQVLANNSQLFSGFCYFLLLITCIVEVSGYYRWYKRAKTIAEVNGSFLETNGSHNYQVFTLCFVTLAFFFYTISLEKRLAALALTSIAATLALSLIIIGVSKIMKRMKLSAKTNRNLTIAFALFVSFGFCGIILISIVNNISSFLPAKEPVDTYDFRGWTWNIYHDELPLTIEDLTDIDYDGYSYEIVTHNTSIFLDYLEADQSPRMDALEEPALKYFITTIKSPLYYDFCKNYHLDNFTHNYASPEDESDSWWSAAEIVPIPWQANEAYQLIVYDEPQMQFLLCYDDRIAEITFENFNELTENQMSIVGEKLEK